MKKNGAKYGKTLLFIAIFVAIFCTTLLNCNFISPRVFATQTANYSVHHYLQNLDAGQNFDVSDYSLYTSNTYTTNVGQIVTANALQLDGFELDTQNSTLSGEVLQDSSLTLNLYYTRKIFFATISSDVDVLINGMVAGCNYKFGEMLNLSFNLPQDKQIDTISIYNTQNPSEVVQLQNNSFSMPAFDITINVVCKPKTFDITINKVFYQNRQDFVTQNFLTILADYNKDLSNIVVDIDAGYHLKSIDGQVFKSQKGLQNISFNQLTKTLNITNVKSDDQINIFLERDFCEIACVFGQNVDASDFFGGNISVKDSKYIFSQKTQNNCIFVKIFYGGDVLINFVASAGYRYFGSKCVDANGSAVGFDKLTEDIDNNLIKIECITTKLNVSIAFKKTYKIRLDVLELSINGQNKKIGQVAFKNELLTYGGVTSLVDQGGNVSVTSKIDDLYAIEYQFKQWHIVGVDGEELVASNFGLQNKDLLDGDISLLNIKTDIVLQAEFSKKTYVVNAVWNGQFGSVLANIAKNGDAYCVSYGDSIQFTLLPKDAMHLLKNYKVICSGESNEQNVVQDMAKDNGKIVTISNITSNITLNVNFVSNTWWEHLEQMGLSGLGTEDSPYAINSALDLALVSYLINNQQQAPEGFTNYADAYYRVFADIDCGSDYYFVPIGVEQNQFNGVFDYNFYKIKNILTEQDASNFLYDGLISKITSNAKVINKDRNYTILVLFCVGIVLVVAVSSGLVFAIEKKRKKIKKVVVLKYVDKILKDIDDNTKDDNNYWPW